LIRNAAASGSRLIRRAPDAQATLTSCFACFLVACSSSRAARPGRRSLRRPMTHRHRRPPTRRTRNPGTTPAFTKGEQNLRPGDILGNECALPPMAAVHLRTTSATLGSVRG
jgi:hypothetical protein